MQILVSLGNAMLIGDGELNAVTAFNSGMSAAARGVYALLDAGHRVVVTHGHDERLIGASMYSDANPGLNLDRAEAIAEGLIGYRLEQELRNLSETKRSFVTVMSQTLVAQQDVHTAPASCVVGPTISQLEAERLERHRHWNFRETNEGWRRVVSCPRPITTLQLPAIRTLMNTGHTVICSGGGLAVSRDIQGRLSGVDVIVDKDLASAQLARALGMDAFLISTDVSGVYDDWSSSSRRRLTSIFSDEVDLDAYDQETMRPKLEAALQFAQAGGFAAIGLAGQELDMLEGRSGTRVDRAMSTA